MAQTRETGVLPTLRHVFRPHPAQTVLLGFVILVLAGTALLMLPISHVGGGATLFESLFTAVSAACVNGLSIVDSPVYWTGFGHVVILALIQVGGFGVMTFASVIGLAVMRRLSLRSRITAAAEIRHVGFDDVHSLVVGILRISLAVEVTVALILTARFALTYGHPLGEALWLGIFHSVSAFNNAGFSLFSNNLVDFAGDPIICLPISAAIILGGLGFPVVLQLRKYLRQPIRWTMNTRLVVAGTLFLIPAGWLYITALEWNNPGTLGPMDWPAKLLAGFFQSVQTRTAGFNSVDVGQLDSATLVGMNVLMLIGGGPAGTAGGIKITTFAVLFFIILSEVRGEAAVNIFGKRLSRAVHRQAITVALLAVAVVGAATVALMLLTDFSLDVIMFESMSAFSTVGMTTGITSSIPMAGQIILIVLMFIGRLGPITFASAIALRENRLLYDLPKERPIIG